MPDVDDLQDIIEEGIAPTSIRIRVPFQEDNIMLLSALSQAGLCAFGVSAVEVWLLNDRGTLSLPENGVWIDPAFRQNSEPTVLQALNDVDTRIYDYIYNGKTLAPGIGIPGYLYAKSSGPLGKKKSNRKLDNQDDDKKKSSDTICWRNIRVVTRDPDQPYNPYALALESAGFELIAGVPFNTRNSHGIVVYFARKSVNQEKLNSPLNQEFILSAAENIGAILGFIGPRKLTMKKRKEDAVATFQKIRTLLKLVSRDDDVDAMIENNYNEKLRKQSAFGFSGKMTFSGQGELWPRIKHLWATWSYKMLGGNTLPPPRMAPYEVVFTFVASFCTYFFLDFIHGELERTGYNSKFLFPMGAVAALMTVVYGLTSAPAAQPRSIILGQGASALIGIICSFISGEHLKNLKESVAVAGSVAFMAAAGITHPPGSAVVLQFANIPNVTYDVTDADTVTKTYQPSPGSDHVWIMFGFLCMANATIVVIAACINNVSSKRHYPTYWGYIPSYLRRLIFSSSSEKGKVTS